MKLHPPLSEAGPDTIFTLAGTIEEFRLADEGVSSLIVVPRVVRPDGTSITIDTDALEALGSRGGLLDRAEYNGGSSYVENFEISGLTFDEAALAGAALTRIAQENAELSYAHSSNPEYEQRHKVAAAAAAILPNISLVPQAA